MVFQGVSRVCDLLDKFGRIIEDLCSDRRFKEASILSEVADKLHILEKEVQRCHARLEIDHQFEYNPETKEFVRVEVPFEDRMDMIDAVECRDIEIKTLQEAREFRVRTEIRKLLKERSNE